MEINRNIITIVGCGPGSPDYLTPIAQRSAQNAQVLVGAQRLLDLFPDTDAQRIVVTHHIEDCLDKIQILAENRSVAVLVSGDPGLFSLSRSLIKKFGRHRCAVIPAVSSVQAAFAATGLSWENAKIISAHHNLPDIKKLNLENSSGIAILTGHKNIKPWLTELINDLRTDVNIFVCQNLTLKNESVTNVDPEQLDKMDFCSRSIVLIEKKETI